MIQFNAKYLKYLMPFMGRGDIRYYLDAVHISPHEDGGAVLVASDGHTMMCVRDISAVCNEPTTIYLHPDAAKHVVWHWSDPEPIATVNTITERLVISGGQGRNELYVQPGKCIVQAIYPNWRLVMPNFDNLTLGAKSPLAANYYTRAALLTRQHAIAAAQQ